jgi:hypothetical protein
MPASAILFGLASFFAAVASFLIFTSATSAIHEILAMVCGLSSAVFGVGSATVFHLHALPARIVQAMTTETARQAEASALATARTMDEAHLVSRSSDPADPANPGMGIGLKVVIVLVFLICGVILYVWLNQPH